MGRVSVIDRYFNIMADVYHKFDLESAPHRIYNLDETGFSKEPKYAYIFKSNILILVHHHVGTFAIRFLLLCFFF